MKPLVLSVGIVAFGFIASPVKAQPSETCLQSTVSGVPISSPTCFVAEADSGANENMIQSSVSEISHIETESQNSASDAVTPAVSSSDSALPLLPVHSDPIPPALGPPS
jgi:hypothetical protein